MLLPVLLKPKRPLPRKFRRRVSPAMRSFASKRHQRRSRTRSDRLQRLLRRAGGTVGVAWGFVHRWWLVGIGGLCIAVIAVAFFSPLFTIREVRIQRGQGRVDADAVQKVLKPLFGQHLLFVSERDIENIVRTVVPDLDIVDVQKQYPSRLFLRVTVQPVTARLVFEEPVAQKADPASASGVVIAPVPRFDYLTDSGLYVSMSNAASGQTLPIFKVIDWGVRPNPGTRLLEPEFLQRVRAAEEVLTREFGHSITSRILYLRAREFHLGIGKLTLWFDVQNSLEEQLQRYRIFLRSAKNEATQYVDLRLKGRVVYR